VPCFSRRSPGINPRAIRRFTNSKPYVLRGCLTIDLLLSCTDLRYIQTLLGHSSSRTIEIYTHVATTVFHKIQNPRDT